MKINYQISTEHKNYPNMTVYDRIKDGTVAGWKVEPNEGYKLYNKDEDSKVIDPITMEERTEITYLSTVMLPSRFNWYNFEYDTVYVGFQ